MLDGEEFKQLKPNDSAGIEIMNETLETPEAFEDNPNIYTIDIEGSKKALQEKTQKLDSSFKNGVIPENSIMDLFAFNSSFVNLCEANQAIAEQGVNKKTMEAYKIAHKAYLEDTDRIKQAKNTEIYTYKNILETITNAIQNILDETKRILDTTNVAKEETIKLQNLFKEKHQEIIKTLQKNILLTA